MDSVEFDEVTIPVPLGYITARWYGDQMQRPLVALHGWMDNCGTFKRLAPLLTPHTSLLCIDLPGHGRSTHLPNGILYHVLEFVRTLLYLMKTYKWDKISLMGHSMGGHVAFTFVSLYPDRVDMIVTLDIIRQRYFPPEMEPVMMHHIIERAVVDNERRIQSNAMSEPPSYTYDECVELLYEGTEYSVEKENCKYLLERSITKSQKYPERYYFSRDGRVKYLFQFNPTHEMAEYMIRRISRHNIPFLVIRGGGSTNLAAAVISQVHPALEKSNANYELHVLDGAKHHLHLNNPHEVAELIIDFWRRKGWRQNKSPAASEVEEIAKSKL